MYKIKHILAIFVLVFLCAAPAISKEYMITISPAYKISTSSKYLQEGDYVDFIVKKGTSEIKEGTNIQGVITSYEENGFFGKNATLLIENFKVKNSGQKLKGLIYCSGTEHNQAIAFVGIAIGEFYLRGGEVHLKPYENFYLYLEK